MIIDLTLVCVQYRTIPCYTGTSQTIYIAPTNKLIRQSVIISLLISREYNLQVRFDVIFHFHLSLPYVINNLPKPLK